jgi:hypothetical protein
MEHWCRPRCKTFACMHTCFLPIWISILRPHGGQASNCPFGWAIVTTCRLSTEIGYSCPLGLHPFDERLHAHWNGHLYWQANCPLKWVPIAHYFLPLSPYR